MNGQISQFWTDILPERIKQYITRHAILMLIPVIMILTGCQNRMQMESSWTAKDTKADADEARENDSLADSEKPKVTDPYKAFLNGELTVSLEEQQVYIDQLFWDNDIEYCYWDIDGDDSDELHIRDPHAYYIIKTDNETPRILFENWWQYEPVATDGLCGILRYDFQYSSGQMEFIRINADGSRQSDGLLRWFDENKSGSMDEKDYFTGCDSMSQYLQSMEEYTAIQAENRLQWRSRHLKHFATWQEAYIDFIQKIHVTLPFPEDHFEYSFIYVDDDHIPELYIFTGGMASGELILSFYNGKIRALNRDRVGIQYLEHGGRLYSGAGNTGFYPSNVYMLSQGEFTEIGTGWCSECVDDQRIVGYEYYWENVPVTEEQFEASINELIDLSKCIEPAELYSESEALEILRAISKGKK